MNPFDFVKAINTTKQDLITEDPTLEKQYQPWLINKALSYFPDTIFQANEMNMNSHLDNKMQFDYFLRDIKKRSRFSKWTKKEKNDNLDVVVEYYGVSHKKAQEIVDLLTTEQLNIVKEKLITGGIAA